MLHSQRASLTIGDLTSFDFLVDTLTLNLVPAVEARSRCERTVALNEFFGEDTRVAFDVVDILSVVCEELVFVLEQADEGVGGRKLGGTGEDVFGYGVEDLGIFAEEIDAEDLLGVVETETFKFRVQACVLGSKVGDTKAG